jgi:hypothetical protein
MKITKCRGLVEGMTVDELSIGGFPRFSASITIKLSVIDMEQLEYLRNLIENDFESGIPLPPQPVDITIESVPL